jgi:hypothetical protein
MQRPIAKTLHGRPAAGRRPSDNLGASAPAAPRIPALALEGAPAGGVIELAHGRKG